MPRFLRCISRLTALLNLIFTDMPAARQFALEIASTLGYNIMNVYLF